MFHKPEDSVFATGERWYSSTNPENKGVVILGKHRFAEGISGVSIYYQDARDEFSIVHDKDAWVFQTRYTHSSERFKDNRND